MILTRILRFIKSPKRIILYLLNLTSRFWPDDIYLKILYRTYLGSKLNLKNPKTLNEKMQWLKLYDRKPEYTKMVDKLAVKEYVANIIGEEYIIPTIGVWDRPEDIDWDLLPNQFVLKTTHGGGACGVVICKDKSNFDIKSAIRILNKSLNSDLFLSYREWPYKNVYKRIIAEKYLSCDDDDLPDYKVYTFNGKAKVILVCRNRFKHSPMIEDYYSEEWEFLNIKCPGHPNSPIPLEKPKELDELLVLSESLSKNIPHLRVDFYIVKGRIFFGELTFYTASGMDVYEPACWDEIFGSWLKLPVK